MADKVLVFGTETPAPTGGSHVGVEITAPATLRALEVLQITCNRPSARMITAAASVLSNKVAILPAHLGVSNAVAALAVVERGDRVAAPAAGWARVGLSEGNPATFDPPLEIPIGQILLIEHDTADETMQFGCILRERR